MYLLFDILVDWCLWRNYRRVVRFGNSLLGFVVFGLVIVFDVWEPVDRDLRLGMVVAAYRYRGICCCVGVLRFVFGYRRCY